MMSAESASFSPIRQHDQDDEDVIQEPSDVTESDVASIKVDPDVCSGVDSIDNRFRESNASAFSRYKVYHTIRWPVNFFEFTPLLLSTSSMELPHFCTAV